MAVIFKKEETDFCSPHVQTWGRGGFFSLCGHPSPLCSSSLPHRSSTGLRGVELEMAPLLPYLVPTPVASTAFAQELEPTSAIRPSSVRPGRANLPLGAGGYPTLERKGTKKESRLI